MANDFNSTVTGKMYEQNIARYKSLIKWNTVIKQIAEILFDDEYLRKSVYLTINQPLVVIFLRTWLENRPRQTNQIQNIRINRAFH